MPTVDRLKSKYNTAKGNSPRERRSSRKTTRSTSTYHRTHRMTRFLLAAVVAASRRDIRPGR